MARLEPLADLSGLALVQKAEELWSKVGAGPEFIQTLRSALFSGQKEQDGGGISRLALLPGLCCQAAGGQAAWADDLSLAWLLFYTAAHLMDSVQDQDEPEAWWQAWGPGVALNAATGLFFTGASALHQLASVPAVPGAAAQVFADFYNGFLAVCGGQFADLTTPEPTLEQYWAQAAAKSGTFFALACQCGARLASSHPATLQAYEQFGRHIGLLVQIKDDLDDVRPGGGGTYGQRKQLSHALPYLFALQALPPGDAVRLRRAVQAAPKNKRAARQVLELIDRSGAVLYLRLQFEHHNQLARQALADAHPQSPAAQWLEDLIQSLS